MTAPTGPRPGSMRVLVACEFSGIVRDAFAARGHDAWSCDLLPTERPGQHIQGNVLNLFDEATLWMPFDLMIAFPPCTFLCSSGLHWNAWVRAGADGSSCPVHRHREPGRLYLDAHPDIRPADTPMAVW